MDKDGIFLNYVIDNNIRNTDTLRNKQNLWKCEFFSRLLN